jgi:hypothetical protein
MKHVINQARNGCIMAALIVMDRSGDTRIISDRTDAKELALAEKRFIELTGAGFTAAVRHGPGDCRVVKSFDGTAEETLFYPQLIGG